MKNEQTLKQIRFYGLSKILVDNIGRTSSNVINDIIVESIKKGTLTAILNKYFLPEQINPIIEEIENCLGLNSTSIKKNKEPIVEKIQPKAKTKEVVTTLEIGSSGFNI